MLQLPRKAGIVGLTKTVAREGGHGGEFAATPLHPMIVVMT